MFIKILSSLGALGEKFIFYSLFGFLLFYVISDFSSIFTLFLKTFQSIFELRLYSKWKKLSRFLRKATRLLTQT